MVKLFRETSSASILPSQCQCSTDTSTSSLVTSFKHVFSYFSNFERTTLVSWAHNVHCRNICASPLSISVVCATSTQATFVDAVLCLMMGEIANKLEESPLTSVDTLFVKVCNNQSQVIRTHVSVSVILQFSQPTRNCVASGFSGLVNPRTG